VPAHGARQDEKVELQHVAELPSVPQLDHLNQLVVMHLHVVVLMHGQPCASRHQARI